MNEYPQLKSIMETEKELNAKIIDITMRIHKEFPELSKYLNEMPITIPTDENPEINATILNNYYESLFKFLASYKIEMAEKEALKKQKT